MSQFFAQNSEDVLLARCFEKQLEGFYIDVGAEDATDGSVTKYFYDRGWRGVNLEPVPYYFEQLQLCRPRDLNLQVAASAESGLPVELDLVEQTGLSSIDQERKNLLRVQRRHSVRSITVMTRTLNEILEWAQLPWIDFLKIDVEGHELSVLKGLDLSRFRPKVIVVETTDPLIHEGGRVAMNERPRLAADYAAIETMIQSSNYVNLFFDGLNTWWADERLDSETLRRLKNAFSTPVNVFDTISPMEQRRMERVYAQRIDQQYQITDSLKGDLTQKQSECEYLSAMLQDALLQLKQLQESSSWKLTKPYRQLGEQLRRLRG